MTVQCVECVHLSRRDTPREFRDLRLLVCKRGPAWQFYAPLYPHPCTKFEQAPADEVKARREWINRKPTHDESSVP